MSEREMRELVVIEPGDVFSAVRHSAAAVRQMLGKMEEQVEEQRLVAWAKCLADPKSEELRRAYQTLCREQGRMMTGFNRWRAANPETEE